jgi:hypothetical protein
VAERLKAPVLKTSAQAYPELRQVISLANIRALAYRGYGELRSRSAEWALSGHSGRSARPAENCVSAAASTVNCVDAQAAKTSMGKTLLAKNGDASENASGSGGNAPTQHLPLG